MADWWTRLRLRLTLAWGSILKFRLRLRLRSDRVGRILHGAAACLHIQVSNIMEYAHRDGKPEAALPIGHVHTQHG